MRHLPQTASSPDCPWAYSFPITGMDVLTWPHATWNKFLAFLVDTSDSSSSIKVANAPSTDLNKALNVYTLSLSMCLRLGTLSHNLPFQ